jgi:hypothetical protein
LILQWMKSQCYAPMRGQTCKTGTCASIEAQNVPMVTKIVYNATNALLNNVKESVGLVLRQLGQMYEQEESKQIDKENDVEVAQ